MDITQVRIFPVGEDKLKAFASVVLDDCFVVSDIKIIDGARGLFVSMPSKKRKNGTFRDVAHPLNSDTRKLFEDTIIRRYREVVAADGPGAETGIGSAEVVAAPASKGEDPNWA